MLKLIGLSKTRDGRIALIPRAVEDSGCSPTIISEACAKSLGLAMRDRRPHEYPHILNIEGDGASKLRKITEPVTFILARGTENEGATPATGEPEQAQQHKPKVGKAAKGNNATGAKAEATHSSPKSKGKAMDTEPDAMPSTGQVLAWSVTTELAGHTFRGLWFRGFFPTA